LVFSFEKIISIIITFMLTVVIQAGGESRRMGRDKALAPFLGKAMIERVIERVSPLADEVLVTTNRPEAYTYLGLPLYPDRVPGRGALGGLYTALSAANQPLAAVVACDMPFVSADLLSFERDLVLEKWYDAVIPLSEGFAEPFHAVYRPATCLPAIHAALQAEKWRVDSWFGDVSLHLISANEAAVYDPYHLAFRNVNTPEELAQAEKIAGRLATGLEP
jgi:molybdopterin-guanine dinucleotide biosynthesis protein A